MPTEASRKYRKYAYSSAKSRAMDDGLKSLKFQENGRKTIDHSLVFRANRC